MALLMVPPELIPLITAELSPDDFESLARACKRSYALLTPSLALHNKYRRNYSKIVLGQQLPEPYETDLDQIRSIGYAGPVDNVPKLLLLIAHDRKVAQYIVHLDLEWERVFDGTDPNDTVEVESSEPSLALLALNQLVCHAQHPDLSAIHAQWQAYLKQGLYRPRDDLVTFLISLLPNLQGLRKPDIFRAWRNPEFESQLLLEQNLLPALVQQADSRLGQPGLEPLCRLRSFQTASLGSYRIRDSNITSILPFLQLKSLQVLHYQSLRYLYTGQGLPPDWERFRPIGPNITCLLLSEVYVTPGFASLLHDMTNLSKLRLHWGGKATPVGGILYQIQSVASSLASVVGQRLRVLSLTADWYSLSSNRKEPLNDLGGYTTLRELDIATVLLYASGDGCETGEASLVRYPSLLTLLANSHQTLERVTIHMSPQMQDFRCLKWLLKDFEGVGIATGARESFLRLAHVRVLLYEQLSSASRRNNGDKVLRLARQYLESNIPGCVIELVPWAGYLRAPVRVAMVSEFDHYARAVSMEESRPSQTNSRDVAQDRHIIVH